MITQFIRSVVSRNHFRRMESSVAGVYSWEYANGRFDVALRPNSVFYCPKYPAGASWSFVDGALCIDWKNYGKYELMKTETGFEGSAVGKPANWRKMTYSRPFTDIETLLMGDGGGSVWNYEWEKVIHNIISPCNFQGKPIIDWLAG